MGDQVLNQFRSYRELREECVAIYEARGGPDTVSEAAENCTKTLRGKYRQSNFFHTLGFWLLPGTDSEECRMPGRVAGGEAY